MTVKQKKFKSGKIKRHKLRKAIGVKEGFGKPWSAPSVTFRVEFSWENPDGSEENEQVHWIECRKFQGEEREFIKAHYAQSTEEWTDGESLESKFVCVYCAKFLVEQRKKAEDYWAEEMLSVNKELEIPTLDKFIWSFDSFPGEPPSSLLTGIAPDWASEKAEQAALGFPHEPLLQEVKKFPVEYFSLPSDLLLNQAFIFPPTKKGNETIRFPIYQIKWTEELAKNSIFNSSIEIVLKNSIWHKQRN